MGIYRITGVAAWNNDVMSTVTRKDFHQNLISRVRGVDRTFYLSGQDGINVPGRMTESKPQGFWCVPLLLLWLHQGMEWKMWKQHVVQLGASIIKSNLMSCVSVYGPSQKIFSAVNIYLWYLASLVNSIPYISFMNMNSWQS